MNWVGRKRGVIDLQVYWVLGHQDFKPNERADEEAKKAVKGDTSDVKPLPLLLHKHLPFSVSVLCQENTAKLAKWWARRWKSSARESMLSSIDNTAPSKKYVCLIKDLDCRQTSILFQLWSGHIGLNHHLFHIHRSKTPSCSQLWHHSRNCQALPLGLSALCVGTPSATYQTLMQFWFSFFPP